MREQYESVLGDTEYEMVELLRKLNLTRPIALSLVCLATKNEITSREIEMISNLRQPEVSIAMRYLKKNSWVEIKEEKKSLGKGRPIKLYKLTVPLENIIQSIEHEIITEKECVLEDIQRLKELT
ncbi:transcriptional regulator [Methanosalsum natronophilum]|uniref:Transcriptional regulator n=2 Tax=Methanosalsum natronophilum TaxID=768733 RepID=A0A424YWT8_9EURY|nr:transcriptional regulator [Methanosalsum natronophilum]MCS3923289.1 putative transcriptional regulator [Methanosalsum natronophilum]RQD84025.1 MAG: transcriptional regulator [Methanosalsum natronophilum]